MGSREGGGEGQGIGIIYRMIKHKIKSLKFLHLVQILKSNDKKDKVKPDLRYIWIRILGSTNSHKQGL